MPCVEWVRDEFRPAGECVIHVLIDTSVYRANPRRDAPEFRALARLARAGVVQLHVPRYVEREVVSQQTHDLKMQIAAVKTAARTILRRTTSGELRAYAEETMRKSDEAERVCATRMEVEFQTWVRHCKGIIHPVRPHHGERVTEDYFAGSPPFRSAKRREDFPDSFIWHTALDIVAEHDALTLIAADEALTGAAASLGNISCRKTLAEFIQADECQDALDDLTPEVVSENVDRIKRLLPSMKGDLLDMLNRGIVNALAGRVVTHGSIPDDNNQARILSVGGADAVAFGFDDIEHYGDGEIGVNFDTTIECLVYFALDRGAYYGLSELSGVSVAGELNEHYLDAEQDLQVRVEGVLSIITDAKALERDDLTDGDLLQLVREADYDVDVMETAVSAPGGDY